MGAELIHDANDTVDISTQSSTRVGEVSGDCEARYNIRTTRVFTDSLEAGSPLYLRTVFTIGPASGPLFLLKEGGHVTGDRQDRVPQRPSTMTGADFLLAVLALVFSIAGALAVAAVVLMGVRDHTPPTFLMAIAYVASPLGILLLGVLWVRMVMKRRKA